MGDGKQGFKSMDPVAQRLIASKGGKAAHAKKTAHQWDSTEARAAGKKGGQMSWARRIQSREDLPKCPQCEHRITEGMSVKQLKPCCMTYIGTDAYIAACDAYALLHKGNRP